MTSSYRQREDLVARRIAGDTIVVPIRGKLADMRNIFSLNESADHLWKELETPRTVEQLCRSLTDTFSVDRMQAEADVREFVQALVEAGLVEGT